MVPIFVYILEFKLQNHKIIGNLLILLLICIGTAISFYVIYHNDQSAGLFAPQNYLVFKLWLNKAYTKIHAVGFGFVMARLFLDINERKLNDENPKKASIFGKGYVALALAIVVVSILIFVSLFPLSANREPPSWSTMKSSVFIGLSRPAYLMSVLWIFHLQWLGYGKFFKRFMTR